jgi:cold shock protein
MPFIPSKLFDRLLFPVQTFFNALSLRLHISAQWASRLGALALIGFALGMIQVDEYAIALVFWASSGIVLLAKTVYWKGFPDNAPLTRIVRAIAIIGVLLFFTVTFCWTGIKRGDRSWTVFVPRRNTIMSSLLQSSAAAKTEKPDIVASKSSEKTRQQSNTPHPKTAPLSDTRAAAKKVIAIPPETSHNPAQEKTASPETVPLNPIPAPPEKTASLPEKTPVAKIDPAPAPPEEAPVFVRHETGAISWFNAGKGYGFIRNANGQSIFVHRTGVLEPGHSFLEDEKVEYDIMRGPKGVQAINVKVQPESIPDTIAVKLPKKIKIDKSTLQQLAERTGQLAIKMRGCITDQRNDRQSEAEAARYCNSLYANQIAEARNTLHNNSIIIEPLQDAIRRMERGASIDELQYAAKILDLLSQEINKHAR